MTDYVSTQVSLASLNFPVGTILIWPFSTSAPNGWLFCQGQTLSQATYPVLYSVIGTQYGAGAFKLPDLMARTALGTIDALDLGVTGGATEVGLTAAQTGMVAHRHTVLDARSSAAVQVAAGSNDTGSFNSIADTDTTYSNPSDTSGSAHTNLQPWMTVAFIIKVYP